MAQLLVRDLDEATIRRLKRRAEEHGRSLQGELKIILIEATTLSLSEARSASGKWQKRLAGRALSESADSIREDRGR